tara:strand:+ start:1263 stop:1619 length:357 start_codon:yes stop_codon:yes gene_type:complete
MKTDIKAIAKTFAKENKVSATKVETLLRNALSEQTKNMGKKASENTVALRKKLSELAPKLSGQRVTAVKVAAMLKTDIQSANNAIRHMHATTGAVNTDGYEDRQAGQRGRRAVIWKFS